MGTASVFKAYVEPTLARIPALEVVHVERHQGREFVLRQTVQRNVLTAFDAKLSRHLAATRGAGFPAYTVAVAVSPRDDPEDERPLAPAHFASAPHALKGCVERALGSRAEISISIRHGGGIHAGAASGTPALERRVSAEDVARLERGLAICGHLGEPEFLDISGDFDVLVAMSPGAERPVILHLANGSLTLPCGRGATVTPFECPIHGFAEHVAGSVVAQGYLAELRHALVNEKEQAVLAFRAAAEEQVMRFDRALGNAPLDGFRLDSAIALVERLRLGLGPGLEGLSEDARITALGWAASIAAGGGRTPRRHIPGERVAAGV